MAQAPHEIRPPAFLQKSKVESHVRMTLREKLWILAALLAVPVVVFFQQFSLDLRSQTLSTAPAEVRENEEPSDPGLSELTVLSKLAVKLRAFASELEDPPSPAEQLAELEPLAVSRVDRVRLALVAGELLDESAAQERLVALAADVTPGGDLARDIEWFQRAYGSEGGETIPPEVSAALLDRHGWFAMLPLTRGMSERNAMRRAAIGDLEGFIAVSTLVGFGALGALVGGITVLVLAAMRYSDGVFELRIEEAVGGPVYLETFVLFAGGFALLVSLGLVLFGMNVEGTSGALVVQEVLMWVLVGVLAWPIVRRVPWSRFAWDVGLHGGQGLHREVRAGVLGWLATTPILIGVGLLTELVSGSGEESTTSGYPMFDSPGGSWGVVLAGAVSAVLWAPIVEEIVFRGALQRYLRARMKWWGAVLVTAVIFGLVHPYTPAGLVQVSVIGVLLGFLREWRGSLIAPITAHFLHNATLTGIEIAYLAALD